MKGRRWMDAHGWTIKDVYRNTTRDGMPNDETITSFSDKVVGVARTVLRDSLVERDGKRLYRIRREAARNVEPLDRREELKARLRGRIEEDLKGSEQAKARAAYFSLCLGERPSPEGIDALRRYKPLVREIFSAPTSTSAKLKAEARAAGLAP